MTRYAGYFDPIDRPETKGHRFDIVTHTCSCGLALKQFEELGPMTLPHGLSFNRIGRYIDTDLTIYPADAKCERGMAQTGSASDS